MRFVIPPRRLQLGHNEFSAGVGFVRHAPPLPLYGSSTLRCIQFAISCRWNRHDPPTLKPRIWPAEASLQAVFSIDLEG